MSKKPAAKPRSRSSAIVRAEHGGRPVTLTTAERGVLKDALREGTDLVEEMEGKVMSYGRYLLEKVFGDDTREALDPSTKNRVWTELTRRAGGPTLKLTRKLLSVSLRMAAYDRRIGDGTFRALDAGRKELLLPLADEHRMRTAAAHVVKLDLTQTNTREYVTALLAEGGVARAVRFTPKQLVTKMKKFRTGLEGAPTRRRVAELARNAPPAEREKMAQEIDKVRLAVAELAKLVRGK